MADFDRTATAFVAMAHRIVWASVATVDADGRPRSRILHPYWERQGDQLVGWVGTSPTPLKRAHLSAHPYAAVSYWAPTHDTCSAACRAELILDIDVRTRVWDLFTDAPEPVGYDPGIIPPWSDGPTGEGFAVLRLDPYHLRVMAGEVMLKGVGEVLSWTA
jgi:hypothetical protein